MKQFVYSRAWLRKTVGVFCILTGVVGSVLPVLPGLVLMLLGLHLVGVQIAFFDRIEVTRHNTVTADVRS